MNYVDILIIGILDLIESLAVFISILCAKILWLIGQLISLARGFLKILVLMPYGLAAPILRAELARILGNFDQAVSILFGVVRVLEDQYKSNPKSIVRRRILTELYVSLVRLYLKTARLDDAAIIIIRASKCLDIDCLPGLQRLDLRTAQIVKAGIAAARLLDEGGFATLTVDRPMPPARTRPTPRIVKKSELDKSASANDQGLHANESAKTARQPEGAKVLPFPTTFIT